MKKLMKSWRMGIKACAVVAGAAFIMAATGCASVCYSSPGQLDGLKIKGTDSKPGQMVFIDTWGIYMFWSVPLVSGDLTWNDQTKSIEGGFSLFSDQVGVDELQTALLNIAESRNCDLVDVNYFDSDTSYAGASYSGLVGALFGSSRMCVSAVMVPRSESKERNH